MPDDPRVRNAEVTSIAKVAQTATTGPQAKQESNRYKTDILRFPENIGERTIPKYLHWIKFTPCIQQKSSYQVQTTNQLSVTDTNRSGILGADGKQIGTGYGAGAQSPISTGAAVTGGAGLGVAKAVTTAISSDDNLLNTINQMKRDFAGGVIGGVAISNINLTRKTRRAANYICLYMPDTVNQQLVNDYDSVSLTSALGKAGLAAAVSSSVATGMQELAGAFTAGQGGGGAGSFGAAVETAGQLATATGNVGQEFTDVLLFSAGLAQNPQVELLFKNIQNREFQFDFKFVPKNPKEADTIRNIVQAFRFFASPEIPEAGKGRYFIPPSEFDITFMIGSDRNPNLPRISTCVLQGVDVNYGSAGQWTAFQDGMPVEISMQLRFKEVEIMHKGLIDKGY